ncbi:unnamed protein product [Absidia cylindrospora]
MVLISERWQTAGGRCHLRVRNGHSYLCIPPHHQNTPLLRRGFTALRENNIYIHPKLAKLEALLELGERNVTELSTRRNDKSFYEFIGDSKKGTNQVVGQDLFESDIYIINELLEAAAMPIITDINDFDLNDFVQRLEQIHVLKTKTYHQKLLSIYYEGVLRRTTTTTPVDLRDDHQYQLRSKCSKKCKSMTDLKRHQRKHLNEKKHKCTVEWCNRSYKHTFDLDKHSRSHNQAPLPCPRADCMSVLKTKEDLTSILKTCMKRNCILAKKKNVVPSSRSLTIWWNIATRTDRHPCTWEGHKSVLNP